jgi:nucleotidyltransferase substrate binding protein (TIGR01987 family)
MKNPDVRWEQRFKNYKRALAQLKKFIDKKTLNTLEEQGLIKSFEYTHELAWNVMKDFYEAQGESNIQGSKDTIRLAFKRGLIKDGQIWMEMVESRKLTVHTYNEAVASDIAQAIQQKYFPCFVSLRNSLEDLLSPQLPLSDL